VRPPFYDDIEPYLERRRKPRMKYLLKVLFEAVIIALVVGAALWWIVNYVFPGLLPPA